MTKRVVYWGLLALALVLVLVFDTARELYIEAHTRGGWSAPGGTFDPKQVEGEGR